MTIVCALHEPKVGTWIASDRLRRLDEWRSIIMPEGKWLMVGEWAIGTAGKARAREAMVRRGVTHPDLGRTPGEVANWMRAALEGDGWHREEGSGTPPTYDCSFILASKDGAWLVSGDFSITPGRAGELMVTGTGGELAIGYCFEREGRSEDLIAGAVRCAARYSPGCGGEPWVSCI